MKMNGIEVNANTKNVNLAKQVVGIESDAQIFQMGDAPTMEELAKDKAREQFNDKVDEYVEKVDQHASLLDKYRDEVTSDLENLEILPLYEGILIKPFSENPFQRIKKEGNLIVDLGGQRPEYKSNHTGEWEEEESFIHFGVVIAAGPTAKYVKDGDVVMWRKPSETPVPFYKQGFVLVNEHSIMVTVNEGLSERFKNVNNG